MKEIEILAIEIYQKNLDFFIKNAQSVSKKLIILDNTIDDGQYVPKYDLEYLNGYFDVKELKSGNHLYSDNSIKISKELTKRVNNDKKSFLFEGFQLYKNYENFTGTFTDESEGLRGIYPIMSYYLNHTKAGDEMKVIEKFIFIGVGLGFHLTQIDNKINTKEYLIIEDDLELFRLSLFCTPYYELAKDKKIYFSISEDENAFTNTINNFLEDSFFLNRYLKYSHFPAHSTNKIKLIQNVLASQDFATFPYKIVLNKYLRLLESINNNYNIVNFSSHFEDGVFMQKPVLLVAAGPSLQRNLKWLQDNHHRFIVMAVSSTLHILYSHNIKPDIVTHLDGFDSSVTLFEGFPARDFLENTIFLFGSFTPIKIRDMFKNEHCFFMEEGTFYFNNYNSVVGPCVGSTSIFLSTILGTKELYLLGIDFSIDKESGATHSSGHVTKQKIKIEDQDKLDSNISFRGNTFPLKGNFTDRVYTIPLFHISIQTIHNKLPSIKKIDQQIYNLNDGAFINETIARHIEDVDVNACQPIDKYELPSLIISTLKKQASSVLDIEDVKSMKLRLEKTKEIKKDLDEYKNSVSHANIDKYLYDLLGIVSKILRRNGRESSNLSTVYYMFFKYTLPLIMDFFNTKDIKNEKRHIKKFDKMMQDEMYNIEKIYEEAIENFVKKHY